MSELKWLTIDPASLPEACRKLYAKYKAQYALAKEAREAFEEAVNDAADLPKGKVMKFGYKFGKLSAAIADAGSGDRADKSAGTLSDFLAAQAKAGRRA